MKKFMKELRCILLLLATTVFVVSFATYIISLFIGYYGKIVVWAMITSLISFIAMLILVEDTSFKECLRYIKRKKEEESMRCDS